MAKIDLSKIAPKRMPTPETLMETYEEEEARMKKLMEQHVEAMRAYGVYVEEQNIFKPD